MTTIDAARRHDLTDAQWLLPEPLLPTVCRLGRPRRWPLRGLMDGVRFQARAGCPWRDVPACYGPWWCVYNLFARWHLAGVWQHLNDNGGRSGRSTSSCSSSATPS